MLDHLTAYNEILVLSIDMDGLEPIIRYLQKFSVLILRHRSNETLLDQTTKTLLDETKIGLNSLIYRAGLTKETEASAARARRSAQETTEGQELSRAVLMLSTTSKPRMELELGAASFSLCVMLPLLSNKIEPSHP